MHIIGVDFSGAKSDRNTWLAQGHLDKDGLLRLNCCRSVQRADLTVILANLDEPAVVAMDFPFSVPKKFASHWQQYLVTNGGTAPVFETMPDLWAAAANTEWKTFEKIAGAFGRRLEKQDEKRVERKWSIRKYDKCVSEAQSPLKPTGNPTMLPMTFRGMQMLHRLWHCPTVNHTCVLPLSAPSQGNYTALLEVMPGAVLNRLGVKHGKYKGRRYAADEKRQREKILLQLRNPLITFPVRVDLSKVCSSCLENWRGDALDAVVAAVAAAMWHKNQQKFHRPEDVDGLDSETVMLEGWLYAPKAAE